MREFLQGLKTLCWGSELPPLLLPGSEHELLPTSSGRAGLQLILEALRIPPGSAIAVPLYCCPTVFESICRAGHRPAFVDIGEDHFNVGPDTLQRALSGQSGIAAAIVVHMFGLPADVRAIESACGGLPIIEDCAHAIGTEVSGRPVGTEGIASFFSFGRGKWPSVGGGAVFSPDHRVHERLREMIAKLPVHPRLTQGLQGLKGLLTSLPYRRPWYGLFALALAERLDRCLDLRGLRYRAPTAMNRPERVVVTDRLTDFEVQRRRQEKNGLRLWRALQELPLQLADWRPQDRPNWYLFPVRFEDAEQRSDAARHLQQHHVDPMGYLAEVATVARERYGYAGGCPNSERAAQTTLVVPHYRSLAASEIDRIAQALRDVCTGRR